MKHFVTLIIILALIVIGQVTYLQLKGNKILEKNGIIPITTQEQVDLREQVINDMIKFGESKKGIPYVWGKWDCSKFISDMLKEQGILSNRLTTRDYAKWNKIDKPSKGDLVLFSHKGDKISHIGLLISTADKLKEWLMIHNSSSKGVIKSLFGTYWTPRYRYSVSIPEIGRVGG